jgi:hypothetical protein
MWLWARPAAWSLLAVPSLLVAMVPFPGAASGVMPLAAGPLPVAIRDGGVAAVTVHAVPFELGRKALDDTTKAALDAILSGVATDCFLSAQIVGHVQPGPQADGDTLAAHRLARARSETVREALIRAGLPADAITSVWDFRFTTREPRATLWLSARPVGEDCLGTSLPGATAQVAAGSAATAPTPPNEALTQSAMLEPAPGIHLPDVGTLSAISADTSPIVPAQPVSGESAKAPVVASGLPDRIPPPDRVSPETPAILSANAEPAPGIHLTQAQLDPQSLADASALAAASPLSPSDHPLGADGPVSAASERRGALLSGRSTNGGTEPKADPHSVAAEQTSAPNVASGGGPNSSAEIVFDTDSSYLPRGAEGQLEQLLATLPPRAVWELELLAAVGDDAGSLSADQAIAYNGWLADRRQRRVEAWFAQRAEAAPADVRRTLLPHDRSRRVVVRLHPLP